MWLSEAAATGPWRWLLIGSGVLALSGRPASAQPAPPDGCIACHERLEGRLAEPVRLLADDVHRSRGFSCADCHGGDPRAANKAAAKLASRGFRGKPDGWGVIEVCGRCHSDAAFMRGFAPRQRVDQVSEYVMSRHGIRLKQGDRRVATCSSCHGAHGIRAVSDGRSPVFPTNVAATCGRCHADPAYMKGRTLASGEPMPTHQRAEYEQSVHFFALTKRNDLSAPTCNDCHGNHGAAPPGVGRVANVCGTCHAVFAQKFEASAHQAVFERGCAECHGNHKVLAPQDTLLGVGRDAICTSCHAEGDNGFAAADQMRRQLEELKRELARVDALTARVKSAGMEVSDQELALGEARSKLTLARAEVHTSDPGRVDAEVKAGLTILAGVDAAGRSALAELRFRRQGLAVSLVAILVFVVALGLKLRQIERRQGLKSN